MCATLSQPPKQMWSEIRSQLQIDFNYNIHLEDDVPPRTTATKDPIVVIAQSKLPDRPGLMYLQTAWGVQLGEHNIYNARIETIHTRATWAEGFQFHRVLVPVISFYELDPNTRRTFEVYKYNNEVFMLAGIGVKVEGDDLRHVVICTQKSFPEVAVHHKRQPVIIPPTLYSEWLTNNVDPSSMINQVTRQTFQLQLREVA